MCRIKFWIILVCFFVAVAGCTSGPEPIAKGATQTQREIVSVIKVFYGTDRDLIDSSGAKPEFGSDRSPRIFYGDCSISLPLNREIGTIPRPWYIGERENPTRHVVLVRHSSYKSVEEFADAINSQSEEKMFVFIHGYNVKFMDAAYRTAQMAHDLQFNGTPIFFSWPSGGGILDYTRDENNIEWATAHIAKFLSELLKDSPQKDLYIVAHSMGTRGASQAIKSVLQSNPSAASRIKELILAAPDIDADIFKDQIMPAFSESQLPVTMYTSDADKALKLSSWLHGYLRVGGAATGAKNLEVVDASEGDMDYLGHSYFAQNVPILNDLHYLVEKGLRADARFMLNKIETADGPYWRLKK